MTNRETRKTYALTASPLNNRLISLLRENGEEVLIFPSLEPSAVELSGTALEYIKNPAQFDWLIFTDAFAADFFIDALREMDTDFFELDNSTVCALGESVADRLRFVQIHADVIPPNLRDETIFSTIAQYAGGEFGGINFLVVGEKSKKFEFVAKLQSEAASIEFLPVYQAAFDNETDLTRLKTLLKGGAIDEFIFASVEDIAALKLLLADEDLTNNLRGVNTWATAEPAFQALQENGLRPLYFHYK
jgi:uroporphyrinogen-III synthase